MRRLFGKIIWWALSDLNVLANPISGKPENFSFREFLVLLKDSQLDIFSRITAIEAKLPKRGKDGRFVRK